MKKLFFFVSAFVVTSSAFAECPLKKNMMQSMLRGENTNPIVFQNSNQTVQQFDVQKGQIKK